MKTIKGLNDRGELETTLVPLAITQAVPVPWNDPSSTIYGVGQLATDNGLNVFVEQYVSMTLGDVINVYWDGSGIPVASAPVTPENLNTPVFFNIPKSLFSSGVFFPFYEVVRLSGRRIQSPKRQIQVKLDIPGGENPDLTSQINTNLEAPILPPAIKKNGVGKDQAHGGVVVTVAPYENMAEYDRIILSWGGKEITYLVQASDINDNVAILVGESTILSAGDGNIVLGYRLIDAVGNRSMGTSTPSALEVYAHGNTLLSPVIDGAVGDTLDIQTLDGLPVTVRIFVYEPAFSVNDTITLTWNGTSQQGVPVHYNSAPVSIKSIRAVEIDVPYATAVATAQGIAVVFYSVANTEGEPRRSKSAYVRVVGVPVSTVSSVELQIDPLHVVADNLASAIATAIVTMSDGNVAPDGTEVMFTATNSAIVSPKNVKTTGGSATTKISSHTVGSSSVIAWAGGVSSVPKMLQFDPPISVNSVELGVNPLAVLADGRASVTATAIVTINNGKSAPDGTQVTFAATNGAKISPKKQGTIGGFAKAQIVSNTVAKSSVTATAGAVTSDPVLVQFNAPIEVKTVLVGLNPISIVADGKMVSQCIALVTLEGNVAAPDGTQVTFVATNGAVVSPETADLRDGRAITSISISSTSAGTTSITATAGGIVSDPATLFFSNPGQQ